MKIRLGIVAVASLALAGCPGEQAAPPAFEEPAEPAVTEPTPPATPEIPAAAERADLEALGGSGVTGEIAALPRDGRTELTLTLTGAPANQSLGARLMSGTCQSPGVEIARLDAVSTDGTGRGQSVTNVGHAPNLILDGNHIAAVYGPGTQPERDQPVACGTLPSADLPADPTTRAPTEQPVRP